MEWALKYARRGWPIFPCEPRGNKPLTEHGLKDASANEETIRAWWTHWPDANIGHPTGQHVVLNVDGTKGERSLQELEVKRGTLPATLTAKTGKGRHLYFTPNGTRIRNSAGKLGPGLDVRGDGGYVILPPSVHARGARYHWAGKESIAPLPAWVAELLAEPERTQAGDASAGEKIKEGRRNARLTSLAGTMRLKAMTPAAIEGALLEENKMRCDPPLAESEVRQIAQSVSRYKPAAEPMNPWDKAQGMDAFLESGEDGAVFLDPENRILARAAVTEIFSPRAGWGKVCGRCGSRFSSHGVSCECSMWTGIIPVT